MDYIELSTVGKTTLSTLDGLGMPLLFYSNIDHYQQEYRYSLNYIAKSQWNDLSRAERMGVYGDWINFYHYEPDIEKADICFLTYQWPHYIHHQKINEAQSEVKAAHDHEKPIIIFSTGDHPANLPFEDVVLFESAGYRSTPGLLYHSAPPSYIPDYLRLYCDGQFQPRPKPEIPVVGFCGQASTSVIQTAYRTLRLRWQQHQYRQKNRLLEPPPFETTAFRARVLKTFSKQPGIRTNFIIRNRYRAGENLDKSHHHPTKLDFVHNIIDSDYTLCMRGGGNFSVRFYETLCLGRIPIFIDTDCLLPFQDKIDYKSYFPWVNFEDLPYAPQIVSRYHSALSNDDFVTLQHTCRQIWLDHMTTAGFNQDLFEKLLSIK